VAERVAFAAEPFVRCALRGKLRAIDVIAILDGLYRSAESGREEGLEY